jgi:hypothetical protein
MSNKFAALVNLDDDDDDGGGGGGVDISRVWDIIRGNINA